MGETRTTQSTALHSSKSTGRDTAIDFTRGVCIISMVIAHIAGGSTLYALSHSLIWVDGSMGFVFLAGVVLGMVRKRTTRRYGARATVVKTLQRTWMIYVIHVLVTLLALAVGTTATNNGSVSAETYGWPVSILRTLILALNPPLSILGLWVVLLLVGAAALYMLSKGQGALMLSLSLAVYAFGKVLPFGTALPGQGSDQAFQVTAWQFLFCLGLYIGWAWHTERVQAFMSSRIVLAAAAVLTVACAVLAHLTYRAGAVSGNGEAFLVDAFNKLDLGPAAIVYALAVALIIYKAARWANRTKIAPALKPVALLGSYSLDSYVISTVAAIILPAALGYPETGTLAQALSLAVICACLVWAYFRQARKRAKLKV